MPNSTLTTKGQTTIPKEVRDYLGLEPGDQIEYVVNRDGEIVLKAATVDLLDLAGALHQAGRRAVTLDEMKAAVRSRAVRQK